MEKEHIIYDINIISAVKTKPVYEHTDPEYPDCRYFASMVDDGFPNLSSDSLVNLKKAIKRLHSKYGAYIHEAVYSEIYKRVRRYDEFLYEPKRGVRRTI